MNPSEDWPWKRVFNRFGYGGLRRDSPGFNLFPLIIDFFKNEDII